jgi:hypothetical protein
MNLSRRNQRGEGKVGCIVSLLVFLLLIAAGIKIIPVLWNNNELKDAAKDMASRASVMAPAAIELQLRSKARELGIGEAVTAGAISARKSGDANQGTCTVTLKYKQKVDFYGVYTYDLEIDTSVASPYINAN